MYHSCLCLVSDTRTSENKNLAIPYHQNSNAWAHIILYSPIAVHFGAILAPCWELRWLSERHQKERPRERHRERPVSVP